MRRSPSFTLTPAAQALVTKHLRLVRLTVARVVKELPLGLDIEDLVSAGHVGLCRAASDYDADRAAFSTYAITLIRGAIFEAVRNWDFYPRSARDRARARGTTLGRVVSIEDRMSVAQSDSHLRYADVLQDENEGPEAAACRSVAARIIGGAVASLPDREREALRLYFFSDYTHKQIGEVLGVSESRAYQIHQQALSRLRNDGRISELAA